MKKTVWLCFSAPVNPESDCFQSNLFKRLNAALLALVKYDLANSRNYTFYLNCKYFKIKYGF
jgi:hypothetical protein